MKSILIVNTWGFRTHWRSSLLSFLYETIRNVRLWNILMAAKLVEQYGREEVRVITDANVLKPRHGHPLADLFKTGSRTC